jgi:hypothetical protein
MQNESVFHPGIRACANVTIATIVRDPFERVSSLGHSPSPPLGMHT